MLVAWLLPACGAGSTPAPRWVELARGFEPAPLLALAQGWQRADGLDPNACSEVYLGVQVTHPLPRAAWQRGTVPGLWSTALPGGAFDYGKHGLLWLEAEGQRVLEAPRGAPPSEPSLRLEGKRIELRLAPEAEPPAELRLVQFSENGRKTPEGVWQVWIGGEEFHAGLPLWSGTATELACSVPEASRLSFELRFLTRSAPAPVRLRVRLDGEIVHELSQDSAQLEAADRWHSFALPPRARAEARLAFEVEGPPGQLLLLHPVLGPAELGRYDARPWSDARPDLVLFLADTFRADGLEVGGGARALAPNLNRFADGALRCSNARSNAAWTLPSISTILTGLAPGQHTANDVDRRLPSELTTLVERLAAAGYRTGAVTDAAFFTPTHGLEQGFESFRQSHARDWDLDRSVARAREFVEHDDGRPLFLLVHTYRTHMPYRVGPDEDLGPWRALKASGCKPLATKATLPEDEWRRRLAECAPRYRELYQEGVRDLDRGFGLFLDALGERGLLASAFVVFTSDHGEALGENDDIFHGGPLFDSKLRIPLLVRGPGVTPRTLAHGATLLDLAPTLAALAGLERDPRWYGESLLDLASERPSFAFWLQRTTQIALVEEERKVLAPSAEAFAQGNCALAFELAHDPREEHPLQDEGWPAALARRRAQLLRELLVPASGSVVAPLNEQQQAELRGLGYGGEDGADEEGGREKQ